MMHFDDALKGTSPEIRRVQEDISQAARSDTAVLITGEPGVGKTLACREIHARSRRSGGPLVTVTCAGVPDSALEAVLFDVQHPARATVFIDGVDALRPRLQARLTQFLEAGGTEQDVRVIAAADHDLYERVNAGTFREGLFYRLNVIHIVMPPLRKRKQDVPLLVDHFLGRLSVQAGIARPQLNARAVAALENYDWPGNVRELHHALGRIVSHSQQLEPRAIDVLLDSLAAPGSLRRAAARDR